MSDKFRFRHMADCYFNWQWMVDHKLERASAQHTGKKPMPYWRPQWRWKDGHVVRNKLRLWHMVSCAFDRERMVGVDLEWASTQCAGRKPMLRR